MNFKMSKEMRGTLIKVKDICLQNFKLEEHKTDRGKDGVDTRDHPRQLKKLINYLDLFSEVNRELIDSDERKKK